MESSNHRVGEGAGNLASGTTTHFQMVESSEDKDDGPIGFEPTTSTCEDGTTLVYNNLQRLAGASKLRQVAVTKSPIGLVVGLKR
jgi:hypothetical protein